MKWALASLPLGTQPLSILKPWLSGLKSKDKSISNHQQ